MVDINFEKQEKAGFNKYNHYQFGTNCCVLCQRDRPLKEEGLYCDWCRNPANFKPCP